MTCEELQPDYLLYAMGTMDEPESRELRAHLDRGCAGCTEGLRQAHLLAYSMGAVVDGPEPARALRQRVLAIGGPERPQAIPTLSLWTRPVALWQASALAAAAIAVALIPGYLWYREVSELRSTQATAALAAKEQHAEASLTKPRDDASRGAVPIFALELERGGGAGESLKPLSIPRAADAVVLALPSDLARQASAAELRDASGRAIWTAAPLAAGDADSTGLTVDARILPPGRYVVVVLAGERTLARLPFQVPAR